MNGQVLNPLIAAHLENAYVTHLVKCATPDGRAPTGEEIKACRVYLDEELAKYSTQPLITLGSVVSKSLLKKSKITIDHGQVAPMKDDRWSMPAYQPSYVMRDPSKAPDLAADFARLGRHIDDPNATEASGEIDWRVVNRSNLKEFFEDLIACHEFSFDLETSGLFPYDGLGHVRCLGIAIDDHAWIIPLTIEGSEFASPAAQKKIMKLVFEALEDKSGVAQNGKFDNHWLQVYYENHFFLRFDTMLAHHLLDENSPHGLKEMSRRYLGVPDYDIAAGQKSGKVSGDPMKLFEYCGKDCVYTLRLKKIFDRDLKKDIQLRKLFYRLTMPAARAFHRIELNGLYLNMDKFKDTYKQVILDLEKSMSGLQEMVSAAGSEPVNWNSPAQVGQFLYGSLGLNPTVFTDKGAASTGEAALIDIKGQHPIADALVRYRELEKFRSTYLDGWRELIVEDHIHFSYKISGTVTGRFSSRLHQVPRDGTIRNLVEAPPGWEFVQGDFSQAEVRIAAELSGDPELMRCFVEGIDVHWKTLMHTVASSGTGEYVKPALDTASKLENRKIKHLDVACELLLKHGHEAATQVWKGWKEARKKAKGIVFGYLFSMSAEGFVRYAKVQYGFEPTLEEAVKFREAFFHLYSRLEDWHKRYRNLTVLNGYVRNLAGRVRHLPSVNSPDRYLQSEAMRQGINSPVQGMIGDFKTAALIEIDQTFDWDELRIVGEVHDSLLIWVRQDKLHRLEKVKEIMEAPRILTELGVKMRVPMRADIEVGPWGAGKGWNP